MQKRTAIIGALVVLGAGTWYAFRPERLFTNRTVSESLAMASATDAPSGAAAAPAALATGRFHGVHHETTGDATIYRFPDGRRVLRFTGFATSNGPDVQVYLVAAPDARDNAVVTSAGFVSLGAIKGNRGDQNYEVPARVDLAKYRTVTIWCRRFGVNFGSAPLSAGAQSAG
ncbi:MAG TPA: DM13 domain-containing protein [Gemmatimonadaceae bacterium]|nr:DM13 domain-containing protein [Gemmatimonadaceae bacterium]